MHLKQLKLAGFKSFVDPTVVPFSSQLIAVVGPNGCGKSNIIDAVRWVMGESSAKNLRGESMVDVIFNGSTTRKSIGQASVELVFDNSMGRLIGPYASYQEIAVKRLVTRDGDSFYYLNGSRCRRRDITDIFLGTGAGARSYSIIGQDTISRLIEARPEDLRAYLEEAAGVSKYKERRRETLQRIGHTRENLARVADIRDELAKQLLRLERQSLAAEHYKSLKHDERLYKSEILALKWQALTRQQEHLRDELSQLSLQHEQHQANMTGYMKVGSSLRETLHDAQEHFQQVQVTFYQLSTDIARLEENIQQQQREKQRLAADKQQLEAELQTATSELLQDSEAFASCEQELIVLQVTVQSLQGQLHEQQCLLEDNESQKTGWDLQWQRVQTELHQLQREAQVEHVRLQHIEQQYQHQQISFEKNQNEQRLVCLDDLRADILTQQAMHSGLEQQWQVDTDSHQQSMQKGLVLRQELTAIEQQLHQAHDNVQTLATKQAALQAAQNAALRNVKQGASALPQWEKTPRLAEMITVADPWLRACELVLGESLHAIVLESVNTLWPALAELQGSSALFVQSKSIQNNPTDYPRLLDKMSGVLPCGSSDLDQIFAADSLAEALAWLPTLNSHQSVVTADGYWLGRGWVRMDGVVSDDGPGLLCRQHDLAKVHDELAVAQDDLSTLQARRDQLHASWAENGREQPLLQQTLAMSHDALRAAAVGLLNKEQTLRHTESRIDVLIDEQEELQLAIEELATQKMDADRQQQDAIKAVAMHEEQLQQLMTAKACWDDALTSSRRATNEAKDALHQVQLQYNKDLLRSQQLQDSMCREQRHIDALHERLSELMNRYNDLSIPDESLGASLNEKVLLHHQLDVDLIAQRQLVDDVQQQLSENELVAQQEEQQAHGVLVKIQQEQLQEQGLVVRAASIVESLTELSVEVDTLLASIPVDITIQMREQSLIKLDEKIKRLGAINLMAIEEYQTELARKKLLDDQYHDLMDALVTLDAAIAKMDKETQLRLKETFDHVNTSFQALFPRLFGGGRALLELTCDNLLEAGVVVMAQPPGKRNSTIHLLSGGEKAMTAVALVFAIFQLNPSPFCMLDEVDAPLDDLNVQRFCELVKEMSQFVQFLFITHNKVTMELADHLIGVTMREPGVSRVVAVDVEEALSMIQ